MPYDNIEEAEKKNPGLSKYSDKAKRGWLSSFNSCMDDDGDESKCFAIAYSVANKVDGGKKSSCNCDVDRGCGGNCGCFGQLIGPSESEGSIADATRNQDILNAKELLVLARILISGD